MITRRQFINHSLTAGTVAAVGSGLATSALAQGAAPQKHNFHLKYAPHFGMFQHHAGNGLVDQIKFMADTGFQALEDNGMMGRSTQDQERIRKAMDQYNMEMGVFVATADFQNPTFVRDDLDIRAKLTSDIKRAIEVAKRVNAKWCTVVPGRVDPGLQPGYQTANVIKNLKFCAEACEKAGLTMVLEPLNPWTDHPGMFLTKIPQAYMICESVGSPHCKILFDIYHQQITEGNIIPNITRAWNHIAYFQIGDNPGRREPTTGEINYKNIFRYIYQRKYQGILGMEHGLSKSGKEGEIALLQAYAEVDNFS